MYRWRRMTPEQRAKVLSERQHQRRPWHSPPHYSCDTGAYLMTAACLEHRPVIGVSPERMAAFEFELLATCNAACSAIFAWIVLPNHYHVLCKTDDVHGLISVLGRLHGRTSFAWNREEDTRGRQVWFAAAETAMKSERHFQATTLYVLNNAVMSRNGRTGPTATHETGSTRPAESVPNCYGRSSPSTITVATGTRPTFDAGVRLSGYLRVMRAA